MSATVEQGSIVQPDAGRRITGLGSRAKVPAEAFDGRMFIFEGIFFPGMFIPPHTHTREDEVTAFIEGGSEEQAADLAPGVPTLTEHFDPNAMKPFGPKDVPENRWFESKSLPARLFIMLSGVTMNVVPVAGSLSARMAPPCRSTTSRAMARPNPLPATSRERDLSTR